MNLIRAITILAALSAAAAFRLGQDPRPQALPANAPESRFSAGRAQLHLKQIARAPHPVGSAEQARVRDYIVGELKKSGVHPRIQKAETARTFLPRVHRAGRVENIVAILPGQSEHAFLFTAHYDSVGTGPGAGDDGASVAGFLESIRILSKDQSRKNTLIFLFSDGEEAGLLGAAAFAKQFDLSPVRAVFDFEARGISGPSIMFQTGRDSGGLLRLYLNHAQYAYGTSMGPALYDLLPNDTDFSIFKQKGFPGLDFAFIGGVEYYHTSLDSADMVAARTIQHQGENILSLARAISSAAPEELEGSDLVFLWLWPGSIARYPVWFARFLAAAALVWTALMLSSVRREQGLGPVFSSLWRIGASSLAAVVSGILLFRAVRWISGAQDSMLGQPFNHAMYACMFVFLALGCIHLTRLWIQRVDADTRSVMAASQLILAILLAFTTVLLPGISYLFLWPLLASLAASAILSEARGFFPWLFAVPAILFSIDASAYIMAGLTVKAGMLVTPLLIVFALSQERLVAQSFDAAKEVFAGFAGGGLLASMAAVLLTASSGPVVNTIAYGFESQTDRAFYFTCASRDDSFTSRFYAEAVRADVLPPFPVMKRCLDGESFRLSTAPRRSHALPEVRIVREEKGPGSRVLQIDITSPRGASSLVISVKHDASLTRMILAGEELPLGLSGGHGKQGLAMLKPYLDLETWHTIIYSGPGEKGARLRIEQHFEGSQVPIELRITDVSRTIEDNVVGKRPPGMISQPEFPFSDGIYLIRRVSF
jgi:hypothetical protein